MQLHLKIQMEETLKANYVVESGAWPTAQRHASVLEAALKTNAELVNQLNLELACCCRKPDDWQG